MKRDELFRDRVDFVYTQRLYTCIFAKRRKISTSLILSDIPFVFFFRILQISSTMHIAKIYRVKDNKRKITSYKQKIYASFNTTNYLLNIFNIDNDLRWDSKFLFYS